MWRFLLYLAKTSLGIALAFLLAAALSTQFKAVNWLFFQPMETFNHDQHTLIAIEEALADSTTGGLLVVGASVCRNSIDPRLLSELLHRDVHQVCTSAQSVQGALALAAFLEERMHLEAVLLDFVPRVSESAIVEGCMRIALSIPDGRSELARFNALSIASDWSLAYLRARTWVAGWIEEQPQAKPESVPGFLCRENRPAMPLAEERTVVPVDPTALMVLRDWQRRHPEVKLIVNLPPRHGGVYEALGPEPFRSLPSQIAPDSCFYDTYHLRCECAEGYTRDLARSLEAHLN